MKNIEFIKLANEFWQIEATTMGGQILHATHSASAYPVLFCSKKAEIAPGKAIRGGVPVCWPWFGASPVPERPIQGFARTACWEIAALEKDFIRMKLPPENIPANWQDFPFELFSEIRISEALKISLIMKNTGTHPVEISCALHTYFAVSNCENVTVTGLEKTPFTVKGSPEQPGETAPPAIRGEICRLYYPQSATVSLNDPLWRRRIVIEKKNSSSTLLWNPGAERCAQIADLNNDDYCNFLCIEANRAGCDTLQLPPGEAVEISQSIRLSN